MPVRRRLLLIALGASVLGAAAGALVVERRITARVSAATASGAELPPGASPTQAVAATGYRQDILIGGAFALLVGGLASLLLLRPVAQSLEELETAAQALTRGDAARPASPGTLPEARTVHTLVRQLAERAEMYHEALRAEEALLVALTESLNEGVVAVDARQRVVRINETARQILRLKAPVPFSADYLPRDRTLREALAAVLRGEDALPSEVRVDDSTLSLTARRLPDGGAILALYDLTPFRRLEAVRRDFVANVSHELRTPLTVITGFVETLADEELPLELRRRFLGMTAGNVRRMQRIVDDLLDLSRIESGGWLPNPSDLDVQALANEIVAPLLAEAESKSVALNIELSERSRTVYVDPTAARQILTNLTENALRHTAAGTVTVFAEPDKSDGVWLGVRDTGTGIPEEHLERIFERFYRADPGRSREAGGTGLGLAIVRHLAESHGGRVRAESRMGAGTTIAALFPSRTANDTTDAPAAGETTAPSAPLGSVPDTPAA